MFNVVIRILYWNIFHCYNDVLNIFFTMFSWNTCSVKCKEFRKSIYGQIKRGSMCRYSALVLFTIFRCIQWSSRVTSWIEFVPVSRIISVLYLFNCRDYVACSRPTGAVKSTGSQWREGEQLSNVSKESELKLLIHENYRTHPSFCLESLAEYEICPVVTHNSVKRLRMKESQAYQKGPGQATIIYMD